MSKPSFLSSLFSISLSLNSRHLAIELSRSHQKKKPTFYVYTENKVTGEYGLVGKLNGASLFNELRRAGVDIDTTKQAVDMRLRTDWNARGVRYQARVSFYPASRIKMSNIEGAGVIRFDNMRIYTKEAYSEKKAIDADNSLCISKYAN